MKTRTAWILVLLCAAIAFATLAIPLYIIRPFIPQTPSGLAFALRTRFAAPWVSALCALVAAAVLLRAWRSLRLASKLLLSLATLMTVAAALATHVNIFERMFKPYTSPTFTTPDKAMVEPDDKVLAVTLHGASHAYPIRTMGYHHIVNDIVSDQPVAATYCTLCHTGLIWSRLFAGRTLTFRLAGINNGNALLRDEQTSSIWQQSTGEAIYGPLQGSHLTLLHSDELTFAIWRAEQPDGLILAPDTRYAAEYDPRDWDTRILRRPVVVDVSRSGIDPHTLMLGLHIGGATKAFPVPAVLAAGLIADRLNGTPFLLVTSADNASIRAFGSTLPADPTLRAATPPHFLRTGTSDQQLLTDTETHSTWNFQGCATSGPCTGHCLTPIDSHKTFWFDWLQHNPSTQVMRP